ncbi:MAG: Na(+)/H(+) antiporter subunit B [Desulfobacterales bacterium]|nr:Na(+)/H(+) antiporter subunit B [Desulfobacterales bacterium]
MKKLGLIIVLICGSLMLYGTIDFPDWADPSSPASTHLSPYFIETAMHDTAVPNIVTAVLADYRGYDTMFETTVIFAAGLACFFLLRRFQRRAPDVNLFRHMPTGITLRIKKGGKVPVDSSEFERIDSIWVPYDLIIKTTCRLLIPFILLFALYVIAHGHHSPGGGFQGGVILGAGIILYAISHNLRAAKARIKERFDAYMCSAGVFIYVGTGVLCLLMGANFLDYSALAPLLGTDPIMARSHGILIVEIGVGIAVMAVMICLYYNLSSAGRQDEGL